MLAASQTLDPRAVLAARLVDLWERTGDPALKRLAAGQAPRDGVSVATEQERSDWLGTCLMETYKNTGDAAVFALLFETSRAAFLLAIQGQLRRTSHHVDAQDVLQEVYLNIYRYPHRFLSDRADAFRNWGHRIVRNTLLKFLRSESRRSHCRSLDEDLQFADVRARSPDRVATEAEGATLVNHAYLLYLNLYLLHFGRLAAKEQRALTMVEVEGRSYRDSAAELGIRLENLKMVIFRGRRKIFRGMTRSLEGLADGGSVAAAAKASLPEAQERDAKRVLLPRPGHAARTAAPRVTPPRTEPYADDLGTARLHPKRANVCNRLLGAS